MASDYKIGSAARNVMNDAIVDRWDAGRVEIRASGATPPATVGAASVGTLLATVTLPNPAFGNSGAVTVGVASANVITSVTASNSGTADYFRIYPSAAADTAADSQGTAGEAADVTDMTFNNKVIVAGGTVAISAIDHTVPIQ